MTTGIIPEKALILWGFHRIVKKKHKFSSSGRLRRRPEGRSRLEAAQTTPSRFPENSPAIFQILLDAQPFFPFSGEKIAAAYLCIFRIFGIIGQ